MPNTFAIPPPSRRSVTKRGWALLGLIFATAIYMTLTASPSAAVQPTGTEQSSAATVSIIYVREDRDRLPPLSLLEFPPPNEGYDGAKLAVSDNNTTGRFLNQKFTLGTIIGLRGDELIKNVVEEAKAGIGFFVVDVTDETLLALSDALKDLPAVIFNAGSSTQRLREDDCRLNVKHTAASYAMLTDALAQYLAWKQWRKLVLVSGPKPEDKRYAESLKRSAKRFGLKILAEKEFVYTAGSRRADGGFEQVQKQIPTFTQEFPEYDVLLVADEANQFGEYFPFRTWIPRPVAGTHGLVPRAWHPASELWGATQFQNRFGRLSGRTMRDLDYAAWMAVRSIGEAATRTGSTEPKKLIDYMLSPKFELAAFKGQKLTYRTWNAQLRQPIFVTAPNLHVTVSPQVGFLHKKTVLDTMGVDQPETTCQAFK
ncbi:MAG: ABC transporter substrate-binding protein [Filomicrobium sp.]